MRRARSIILQCFSLWATGWEFIFVGIVFANTSLQLKVICVKDLTWLARTYEFVILVRMILKIYCL